jgi:hypothetical protein
MTLLAACGVTVVSEPFRLAVGFEIPNQLFTRGMLLMEANCCS